MDILLIRSATISHSWNQVGHRNWYPEVAAIWVSLCNIS